MYVLQLNKAHSCFKQSWSYEDLEASKICDISGFTQKTASFDDCVRGDVVTDYGVEYDFTSIMHYGLTE